MSAIKRTPPPKRFTRIYGRDYRSIALSKRREEKKINWLLKEFSIIHDLKSNDKKDEIDNINQQRKNKETFDNIVNEGLKRLLYFEKMYQDLKNTYKNRYFGGRSDHHDLPLKRSRCHAFASKVILEPHKKIFPGFNYPKITNFVVTAHFGREGKDLYVDQHRIPLYLPNAVKNNSFAAVIIPQDGATALFFSNCKTVVTGTTTPESALFALQMYRLSLSRVLQPVIVYDDTFDPPKETYEIGYLKTILDFTGFKGRNTVGSGPIAKNGYTVDLSALIEVYPEANWKPEIFPGLKFHLSKGNKVIPGGKKCTAHLFEGRIVLMSLKNPDHIAIAYYFFLDLVKPFLDKSSPEYEEDRYSYRYKQMLWKLNLPSTVTESTFMDQAEENQKEKSLDEKSNNNKTRFNREKQILRNTMVDEYTKNNTMENDASIVINKSDSCLTIPFNYIDNNNHIRGEETENKTDSLFDFNINDQLPADMIKKMKMTMKASSKIKSLINNNNSVIDNNNNFFLK